MGNRQSSSQIPSKERKTAVVLIDSSGSGKSILLTQLGATTLESGVRFRSGYTAEVKEEEIILDGQRILLIDVPWLMSSREKETQHDARMLAVTLSRNYDYYLYFIMKAGNRGPTNAELVMMSKINDCIKQTNDSQVSFRVIVNQIMSQGQYDVYQEHMVDDNCKSLFKFLEIPGYSFNIKIDSVSLVRFEERNMSSPFRDILVKDIIRKEKPLAR